MHKHFEFSVLLSSCSPLFLSSTMSSCPVLCSALLIYSQISPSYFSHHKTYYVLLYPVHPFPTLIFSILRNYSHISFIHLYYLLTSPLLFPFVFLASILSCVMYPFLVFHILTCLVLFYSILFYSILFYSVLFCSILSYPILCFSFSYCYPILFILFPTLVLSYSIIFCSILCFSYYYCYPIMILSYS